MLKKVCQTTVLKITIKPVIKVVEKLFAVHITPLSPYTRVERLKGCIAQLSAQGFTGPMKARLKGTQRLVQNFFQLDQLLALNIMQQDQLTLVTGQGVQCRLQSLLFLKATCRRLGPLVRGLQSFRKVARAAGIDLGKSDRL